MNRASRTIRRFAAALLFSVPLLSLSACGGAAVGLIAGGGIGGTGFSTGAIIAFGSVIVNGVEFQTTDNTIRKRLDDSPDNIQGRDNEVFQKGMVIRVHYSTGDNTALQIDFQDDLEGPVSGIDDAAGTFTVLGQRVAFDNATNFLFEQGATLVDNTIVEVSGLYDADGLLHATYIKVEPAGKTTFEIKGFVSGLDTSLQTFRLGPIPGSATVTVSYSAAQLKDLPSGLANGLYVEVKTQNASGTLVADSIEGRTSAANDAPSEGEASVEGFVADLTGNAGAGFDFTLNGIHVHAAPGTDGIGVVAPNVRVEAEGTVSNGILNAEKIEPR
ncbi:MAG: hypothetical protein FIA93_11460 [Deltaproteobacteria bacterium]|nr:hypothetical protein [Deltaproteobacteria bacterium]PWB60828.1 MAG: hypothetical protein C3F14_12470 [Deltaproteobacteria bacterium]